MNITKKHVHTATSGIIIVDKNYWGKGVASASHHARTWYAFENLGLHCIKSAVVQGNIASLRALQRCGYTHLYTQRNDVFINGKLHHTDHLECLNPIDWAWNQWWGSDQPSPEHIAARQRSLAALEWARERVVLL